MSAKRATLTTTTGDAFAEATAGLHADAPIVYWSVMHVVRDNKRTGEIEVCKTEYKRTPSRAYAAGGSLDTAKRDFLATEERAIAKLEEELAARRTALEAAKRL